MLLNHNHSMIALLLLHVRVLSLSVWSSIPSAAIGVEEEGHQLHALHQRFSRRRTTTTTTTTSTRTNTNTNMNHHLNANQDECDLENEQIWFGENGQNPRWFQSSFKDFSPFIDIRTEVNGNVDGNVNVNVNTDENNDPNQNNPNPNNPNQNGHTKHRDYTNLMEHLKPSCEILGGILYSISGTQECTTSTQQDTTSTTISTYTDTNLPICIGPSCDINLPHLESHVQFSHCPTSTTSTSTTSTIHDNSQSSHSIYQTQRIESDLSKSCRAELYTFNKDVAYGQPDLAFDTARNIEDHCTVNEMGIDFCDFDPIVHTFVSICEAQGGRLYKFSDQYHQVIRHGIDDIDTTIDSRQSYQHQHQHQQQYQQQQQHKHTYLNQPVCIGASCDVEHYFEQYIIGYFEFALEGIFHDENGIGFEQEYHMIGYEAVTTHDDADDTDRDTSSAGKMQIQIQILSFSFSSSIITSMMMMAVSVIVSLL